MFVLFISTDIETLVPLCLTASLRGLQEAALCLAADGGRCQHRKGLRDGRRPRSVRASALGLIFSALTLNTCQPACYLLQASEGRTEIFDSRCFHSFTWTVSTSRSR